MSENYDNVPVLPLPAGLENPEAKTLPVESPNPRAQLYEDAYSGYQAARTDNSAQSNGQSLVMPFEIVAQDKSDLTAPGGTEYSDPSMDPSQDSAADTTISGDNSDPFTEYLNPSMDPSQDSSTDITIPGDTGYSGDTSMDPSQDSSTDITIPGDTGYSGDTSMDPSQDSSTDITIPGDTGYPGDTSMDPSQDSSTDITIPGDTGYPGDTSMDPSQDSSTDITIPGDTGYPGDTSMDPSQDTDSTDIEMDVTPGTGTDMQTGTDTPLFPTQGSEPEVELQPENEQVEQLPLEQPESAQIDPSEQAACGGDKPAPEVNVYLSPFPGLPVVQSPFVAKKVMELLDKVIG